MAAAALAGKWQLDSNENWEAFMEAMGVNIALRKIGNATKNQEEWTIAGDKWDLKLTSTFKNKHLEFQLGQPFDEETMDGRKVKTTFTVEGDKLVQRQDGPPHNVIVTRQVVDGVLHVTYVVPDVPKATSVRKYARA